MPRLLRSLPIGIAPILLATVVAGGSGYIVNAIVPIFRTQAEYADFSILWSALYLIIAALSGVQQEVTRATKRRAVEDPTVAASPVRGFAVVASAATGLVILITGIWWLPAVVGGNGWALAVPLAIGTASYILVAVLCGTMYGLELWKLVGLMIGVDGVLRLLGVVVALLLGAGTVGLFWAVVLPFPLTPFALWFFVRKSIVKKSELDVAAPALTWNVLRTIVASAATGVLISGYPLLLAATSPSTPKHELATVNLSINLIRAPLVIVVLSLQSYLVVRFRTAAGAALSMFLKVAGMIIATTIVLSALAWLLGPFLLGLFGRGYVLDGWVVAALVGASGMLGVLCVSGPLALGLSQHGVYVTGWVLAAVTSILLLLVPGELVPRMLISLAVGPVVGVATHVVGVVRGTRKPQSLERSLPG
ncbi:hypothetical protein [Rathayibacter soli]|uniref:hypothetical protein n=1 Tax=Rathayibacter soli TaxID=3144168 RepID=UPI0027E4C2D4|nr:hypothetical protein [Glaciibacter superstes]